MRIYTNPLEAMKESERDLWEMGIDVHPQTMQDKVVKDDPEYATREIRGYSFKITGWRYILSELQKCLSHFFGDQAEDILTYCLRELLDRMSGKALNPGNAYIKRPEVWNEFLHNGKFAYTYSERMSQQVFSVLAELRERPDTRQGIISIFSYISPIADRTIADTGQEINIVEPSADYFNRGGGGRIPCSMYYQLMIREGMMDLIYTMRSCDLLTHFPIDIVLALMVQEWYAAQLNIDMGTFTYFVGSLHAYRKDMAVRGIF